MVARPVSDRQLLAAVSSSGPDRLFEVIWSAQPSAPLEPVLVSAWGTTDLEAAAVVYESSPQVGDAVAEVYAATRSALAVLQSWLGHDRVRMLVVATRGAMALPGEDVTDLAGAAVWGLARGPRRRSTPGGYRSRRCRRRAHGEAIAAVLAPGEPQVLVRGTTVYTARVRGSRAVNSVLVPPGDGPWRLGMSSRGTFENLRLERIPDADTPLQPGQVRGRAVGHRCQLPRCHDRAGPVPRRGRGDGHRGHRASS